MNLFSSGRVSPGPSTERASEPAGKEQSKGSGSIFTQNAKRVNLEQRGNKLRTGIILIKKITEYVIF